MKKIVINLQYLRFLEFQLVTLQQCVIGFWGKHY